jgi:hypothetical protein
MKIENRVVCLVGSTKPEWRAKYREVLEKLTLMGNAVFTVVWFRGDFQGDFESRRELMENVHFLKIRSSEVIVCIDRKAIGEHTAMEIAYARKLGKSFYYFDEVEGEKETAK